MWFLIAAQEFNAAYPMETVPFLPQFWDAVHRSVPQVVDVE